MKSRTIIKDFRSSVTNRHSALLVCFRTLMVCLFLISGGLSAQNLRDSVTINQIQDELKVIKELREKDSLKMALLTQELKNLMFLRELPATTNTEETVDSLFIKQKAEIERLRQNIEGVPVIFFRDTLFSIYSSLGPYDARTRADKLEESLNCSTKNHFSFRTHFKLEIPMVF